MRAMSSTRSRIQAKTPKALRQEMPCSYNCSTLQGVGQQGALQDVRPITPCPPYGSEQRVQACLFEHFSGPSCSLVFALPCRPSHALRKHRAVVYCAHTSQHQFHWLLCEGEPQQPLVRDGSPIAEDSCA